jgi:integrase
VAYVQKKTHVARDGRKTVSWRVRYRDPDGRLCSETFARKVDADRFAVASEADVLRGEWFDPAAGRRPFKDLAAEWRANMVGEDTTLAQIDSHLRNHIVPFFAERPTSGIRPSAVQAWVQGRAQVLAPATLEVVYRYLGAIFRSAVADGIIPRSPCVGIKLPAVVRPPVRPMLTEHVTAVMEALPARYRALVVAGAGAGLRPSETMGLTVPHIGFLRREIHVAQQLITRTGGPAYLRHPKRGSVRTVPVGDWVTEHLARHFEEFPPGTALETSGGAEELLVFTDDQGRPVTRNRLSDVWTAAAKKVDGLPAGTTPHDLRHYYASLLIHRGASVKVVQDRLGHRTATETLNVYAHLWPDTEDLARMAVDEVLGAPAAAPRTRPMEGSAG